MAYILLLPAITLCKTYSGIMWAKSIPRIWKLLIEKCQLRNNKLRIRFASSFPVCDYVHNMKTEGFKAKNPYRKALVLPSNRWHIKIRLIRTCEILQQHLCFEERGIKRLSFEKNLLTGCNWWRTYILPAFVELTSDVLDLVNFGRSCRVRRILA